VIVRRIPTGAGLGAFGAIDRLMNYLEGEDQSRGEVRLTNLRSHDAASARIEYVVTQARNRRALSERNYHMVISFDSRDRPALTPQRLAEVEGELVAGIGLAEHQRMSIVHHDTANTHIHVMVNLIHPVKHTIAVPWRDKSKLSNLCAQIQDRLDLVRTDQGLGPKVPKLGRAAEAERRSGERSFAGWCAQQVEIGVCKTWEEVHALCSVRGIELVPSGRGLVLTGCSSAGERWTVAAHRVFGGRASLERRLGEYEPPRAAPREPCSYRRAPLHDSANSRFLYAEYLAVSKRLAHERVRRMRHAKTRRDVALARLAAEIVTDAVKAAIREVRRIFGETVRKIMAETPKRTWLQYLEAEAARGRVHAMKEKPKYGSGGSRWSSDGKHGDGSGGAAGGGGARDSWKRAHGVGIQVLLPGSAGGASGSQAEAGHFMRVLQERGLVPGGRRAEGALPGAVPGDLVAGPRIRDPRLRRADEKSGGRRVNRAEPPEDPGGSA